MIEALCAPARAIHDVYDVYDRREEWRKKAFADALPALLRRTTDPALRRRPLEQADDGQFADLAGQGVVTAADLPAILSTHRPTPGLVTGLARHPGQVDDAIGLLRHLHDTDLERVVSEWNPRRYRADTEAFPPVPPALSMQCWSTPSRPAPASWTTSASTRGGRSPSAPAWACPTSSAKAPLAHPRHLPRTLARTGRPSHARHGRAASPPGPRRSGARPQPSEGGYRQLLPHARHRGDSEEDLEPGLSLDAGLLEACLPALCPPEMAGLPKPSVTARHRLHHVRQAFGASSPSPPTVLCPAALPRRRPRRQTPLKTKRRPCRRSRQGIGIVRPMPRVRGSADGTEEEHHGQWPTGNRVG
ncbi:hypothetical protein [Streptomyces mirabilis]|uniref:hypothetical protein n=1 Tax=Streptomyces mirabilis TaxID=68239 RepID=UPI000F13EF5D